MNECCQLPENLVEQEDERPDVTVRRCEVCGCRHIEFEADPGVVGVELSSP